MIWQSWGHSDLTPQPGEINLSHPNPRTQYETRRVANWFDHYLKGHHRTPTGPRFAWFRDWVRYSGNAAPAYAHADHFPVGKGRSMYLSGDKTLRQQRKRVTGGSQSFVTPPAGAPTSLNPLDVIAPTARCRSSRPRTLRHGGVVDRPDAAGPLRVVGSPVLRVRSGHGGADAGGRPRRAAGPVREDPPGQDNASFC